MECVAAQVKRWLNVARSEHDSSAAHKAFQVLKSTCTAAELGSGPPAPSELFILCCEQAIAMDLWDMAQQCVDAFQGELTCNRMLEARALYCEGIVQAHFISEELNWNEIIEERLHCASCIIRGITIAVDEWPREAWAVVHGAEKLWQVIMPLYQFGHFKAIIDIVGFVVTLHEKLMIGGGNTSIQWVTRLAVCLRGAGRIHDAIAQLNNAMESAVRINNERLQVQLLRMLTTFIADGGAPSGSKSKQAESAKFLLHQAVQVSQLFMVGQTDVNTARPDLIAVYDRLVTAGTAEKEPSQPPPQPTKIKGKSKNPIPELLGDADIIQEVLSDVVLCLAFCNESKRCEESIQKLRASINTRARTFGHYASIMATAYDKGVMEVIDSPDASYLTPPIIDILFQCIQEIESAMDGAKMIQDGSERSYSLQVGCSLLWNFCLPLLQDETHSSLLHVLNRIVKETDERSLFEPEFQVRVEYESSVAEFNEDNLSLVVRRVHKALSRGYAVTHPDGTVHYPINFSLLWLLRRCEIRTAADVSELTSLQDQAMYHLEQAESATTSAKCIAAVKTTFSKLPLLTPDQKEETPATLTVPLKEPRDGGRKMKPSDARPHHPPKHSLARLYLQLLKDCVDNFSPSLLSIAKSTATALCQMEIAHDVKYTEFIYMKAYASLLLSQVLLMEYETATPEERKNLSGALFQAFRDASGTESVLQSLGCSSAWMTINSCLSYLDYKAPTFSAGNFEGVSGELAEMYNFFIGLHIDFERESSLTVDLSLMYILSLLDDYVRAKGGFPAPQPTTYDEFLEAVVRFTPKSGDAKNDQSVLSLRRAQEVCVEVMQRVLLPSEKTHICRLYPAIARLLGLKTDGSFHHPQELLLNLLGRVAGPLSPEDKRSLVTKDAWELLQQDPSVQLCGQVALYAMELGEERLVLDICKLAGSLYHDGKLGWGTVYPPAAMSAEKDKGSSKQEKKEAQISPAVVYPKAVFPKPKHLDWFWYSKLLLLQAIVLSRRCGGIAPESKESLSLMVLSLCANSAIAASHGPFHSRHSQIASAINLFYSTLCNLWRCGSRGKKILASLKMMLSNHVLSNLHVDVCEKNGVDTEMQHLFEVMSSLGHMMIRACAMEGLFMEGMNALNALLQVLPRKYHSSFKVQEVKYRCEMGLPVHKILHASKAEDVETASLVWMTYAQHIGDQTKAVEAWKYAVNVLTGYPFAKANCLLEMVQHVSVHGLLTTKEVKLLLLSALDLIEGFDRAVNESCVNASTALQALMDERAKTYPGRLIATLTGRSLIMPALSAACTSNHAATLKKNLPPVALKDIMMAIRIVFVLFSISPTHVEKGAANDHMTKRECVMLLLHYIDCLWRLASAVVTKRLKTTDKYPSVSPMELPLTFGGWFGFFFSDEHVELLREGAAADAKHNTEGMQGIFFDLGRYLLDQHMEHYCFMVYLWAIFAAGWRYGCADVRYTMVKRTAFSCCKMAAASCGCGHQIHLFKLPDLTPAELAALDVKMAEVHLPGPLPPPTSIVFSPHVGSLQDILLRRAFVLDSFGRVKESQMFLDKIQHRTELLEDWDSYARCILIRANQLALENKYQLALELMAQQEADGLLEKLSPRRWLNWEQQKVEFRVNLGKDTEIVHASAQFVEDARRLISKQTPGTVGHDVAEIMVPDIIESYQCFLINYIMGDVILGNMRTSSGESSVLKGLLSDLCDALKSSERWIVRFGVAACRYRLRCGMLDSQHSTMDDTLSVLMSLANESANIESLLQEISVTTAEVAATLCLETTDTPLRPSQCVAESYLLFLRGENIMTRLRIAQHVLDVYRSLSMEELGIPSGGPPELEKHVLDFMRDPMKKRGLVADQEEQRMREAKWSRKIDEIDDEARNAFDYYGLPMELIGDVSAFDCRAALYQAREIAGPEFSPAYFSSFRGIARTELRCLLEKELNIETSSLSVEARIDDLLNKKWSQCPIFPVEKVVPGKKGGSEKAKKNKDPLGDWKPRLRPVEITESDAAVLNSILEAISDAAKKFDYNFLYESYLILADFFIMWQRPQAAGTAVEFAQTARLVGYLSQLCFMMTEDTEEGRAWKCLRTFMLKNPLLTYSSSFEELRKATLEASPVLSYVDLPSEWPDEPEANLPFALPETVTLSIVQLKTHKTYFVVALRHPDGTVDCRRKKIRLERIKELVTEYEAIIDAKRQTILEETRKGTVRTDASVTVEDLQDYLASLYETLQPLLEDIEESLENLAPKYTLYLCLDPMLQPLPVDHLPCFSAFVSVQREISIISVKRKLEVKLQKSATVLYVVDPFGDNLSSVETFSSEKKSSKENHVLTATDKAFPFSMEYLLWVLEQPTYQAVLFNMCGSLSSILSSAAVSSIRWNHILTVMIGADAVNETSMRREQKNELTKDSTTRMFDKKWLLPLLLLLRGVRYVAMNTCPSTPPANDALCKRVVPALSTGKGIFEAVTGRHVAAKASKDPKKTVESTKKDLVMFFGVPALTAKGKHKVAVHRVSDVMCFLKVDRKSFFFDSLLCGLLVCLFFVCKTKAKRCNTGATIIIIIIII
eukprot:gene4419-3218_t